MKPVVTATARTHGRLQVCAACPHIWREHLDAAGRLKSTGSLRHRYSNSSRKVLPPCTHVSVRKETLLCVRGDHGSRQGDIQGVSGEDQQLLSDWFAIRNVCVRACVCEGLWDTFFSVQVLAGRSVRPCGPLTPC